MRSLESFCGVSALTQHLSIVNLRLFPCERLVQDGAANRIFFQQAGDNDIIAHNISH